MGVVAVEGHKDWKRSVLDCLQRWGLHRSLEIQSFRFVETLEADDVACVHTLLAAPAVTNWLAQRSGTVVEEKRSLIVPLRTTATSLALFDSLAQRFVAGSGDLKQCPERILDGIAVHDLLRKCLVHLELQREVDGTARDVNDNDDEDFLEEDEASPDLPTDLDSTEFLFNLFALLAIGGSMCQHDDQLDAYLATAKVLYRELVSVYRSASTGDVIISTKAFRVYGRAFFATNNRLQRFYILLERRTRLATLVHSSMSGW